MNKISKSIKLLLVDDESEFRAATVKALERRGFKVTEAANGEEALKAIRRELPEIVLLDLLMPGMSGIETLGKIREIEWKLPVIILTGHGTYHDAIAGINLEIVDFLQKPVDIELLEARIRKFIEHEISRPLRESAITELMVSPALYPKLYLDQPVIDAVEKLITAFFPEGSDNVHTPTIRSVLVYDRDESFIGLIRFPNLLKLVLPPFLGESPYSSYFTGMFLAQCKMVGQRSINEIMSKRITIDINAPLMQAVHLMIEHQVINLPVMKAGELVGILREKDIILDIANNLGMLD